MPYVESVLLANPSDQNDIEVTAIHALPPFHSSRFHRQVFCRLSLFSVFTSNIFCAKGSIVF